MRRTRGLSLRLLVAIGVLAVLHLAIFGTLLVALHGLRDADRQARAAARVGAAANDLRSTLLALEAAERGVVIAPRDPLFAAAWRQNAARLRETARAFVLATGSQRDPLADSALGYLARSSAPLVALAPRDPAAARAHAAHAVGGQTARGLERRLDTLVIRERATRDDRRDRAAALTDLAWVAGALGIAATILCAVGVLAYVRRAVLSPLRRVSAAARTLAAGDLRARVADGGGSGEVAELAHTFDHMAASLEDSRAALERQNTELAQQSVELVGAVRSAREGASVLRAVLDATPDAIALLDTDGTVLVDNPPMRALRRVSGTRASALDETGALVPLDAGERQTARRDEITLVGTRRAFARYAAPVHDERGRQIGRLLVLSEITGEREAERAKEDFFALVSHELRTPLTAILGYVELVLAEDRLEPEHQRHLAVVERNAQRLLRLVGDLLFAAQVERGALALEPSAVDLPQLVRDAIALAQPRAVEAGVELAEEIASPATYVGDRDRLAQLLDNLISNALKFTPPGGRVAVRLNGCDGAVELTVADTGVGIPEDELPHLFDRFYRATNATAGAIPGLGLGLMIARAIVEGHGGTIAVASRIDAGTTFTIALPLRVAAGTPLRSQDAERYGAGGR